MLLVYNEDINKFVVRPFLLIYMFLLNVSFGRLSFSWALQVTLCVRVSHLKNTELHSSTCSLECHILSQRYNSRERNSRYFRLLASPSQAV